MRRYPHRIIPSHDYSNADPTLSASPDRLFLLPLSRVKARTSLSPRIMYKRSEHEIPLSQLPRFLWPTQWGTRTGLLIKNCSSAR
jgi:hypothetical protein